MMVSHLENGSIPRVATMSTIPVCAVANHQPDFKHLMSTGLWALRYCVWGMLTFIGYAIGAGVALSQPPEAVDVDVNRMSREAQTFMQQLQSRQLSGSSLFENPTGRQTLPSLPNASPPGTELIPLAEAAPAGGQVQLRVQDNGVYLTTRNATVSEVLAMISSQMGLNIVTAENLNQRVNVTLNGVLLEDALNTILSVNGLVWARHNNIITISTADPEKKLAPNVQGKAIQVFTLNYAMGEDINQVILGLLSPIGKSYVIKISKDEQRAAREQLVVEDLPPYIERIAQYVSQVDIAPRQVVVEAHILQVALKESNKHGVNFNHLARLSDSRVRFQTLGFATRSEPIAAMEIQGTDLTGWLECLKETNDTKTLASPKVAVLNGQEAKITVGGKLGYLMTTATQTAALQSVSFLDFGVMLTVLPIITEDGRVLMKVTPTVSTARINPTSKLPESESTEVTTNVMFNNGQAFVIGGLIKEEKIDNQSKIPYLGDIPLLGRLFRANSLTKNRSEIIIALLPRIANPGDCGCLEVDSQFAQASTPIMDRNLNPIDRSAWEGEIPGAAERKKHRWWTGFLRKRPETAAVQPMPTSEWPTVGETPMPGPMILSQPPIGFAPQIDPLGSQWNTYSAVPGTEVPPVAPVATDVPTQPGSANPVKWYDR